LGANSPETAYGIVAANDDSAYVTGYANGPGFPVENPIQRSHRGDSDVFVTKFAPDGQSLVYSTYLGGRDRDTGQGIALAENGLAVVVGHTLSKDFPRENAFQNSLRGDSDAFLAQLSDDGSSLKFSTFFGGTVGENGQDVAVDRDGRIHLTGSTNSTSFPVVDPVQNRLRGLTDAFVSSFSSDGQQLLFSTFYGGSREDVSRGVAPVGDGSLVFCGYTDSADFPTLRGFQDDYAGQGDAFVARIEALTGVDTPVPTTPVPTATYTPSPTLDVTETASPTASETMEATPTITTFPSHTATTPETETPTPSPTSTEDTGKYYIYLPFGELP
jgi:hypothetical protein